MYHPVSVINISTTSSSLLLLKLVNLQSHVILGAMISHCLCLALLHLRAEFCLWPFTFVSARISCREKGMLKGHLRLSSGWVKQDASGSEPSPGRSGAGRPEDTDISVSARSLCLEDGKAPGSKSGRNTEMTKGVEESC